jgi:hypothetical protein
LRAGNHEKAANIAAFFASSNAVYCYFWV